MATNTSSPFSKMQEISRKTTILSSILQVLEWDQETYMPPGAIEVRSSQIELMSSLIHKQKTSTAFKKALSNLVDLETGSLLQKESPLHIKSAARLWHKEWSQSSKLPTSFIRTCARTSSASLHAWDLAKKNRDFNFFAPYLEKTVALARKKAELLGYKQHPYDALLDHYEPDLTVSKLTPLFSELKESLLDLLKRIQQSKNAPLPSFDYSFDPALQMQLGKDLLNILGFSENFSRLDLTSHPFCVGIHPLDTRLTTRIFKGNLISHILSVLHEAGHGLYNTQLPQEYYGTPLCEPLSFGVDESQSRLWETIIGRGLPFWQFFYPKLQATFPNELNKVPLSDFYQIINEVKPSLIRVEADEVTYCLHIILRFEIEKSLIEGSLKVKDLPKVWNAKMQEFFGITPSHDGEGCLQDIHWAMGCFGYFPTYALGNLLAAQLFDTIKKAEPNFQPLLEKGDFGFMRNWLKENIHKQGKIYKTEELIENVTGRPLDSLSYIHYLENKYGSLYNLAE